MELGLPAGKCSSIGRVPGTGGIDVDALAGGHAVPPSQRERLLFVPKAYEHLQSKVLPVLEALKIVWPRLAPCKVICTAVNPDALPWFHTLPAQMQASIEIHPRLPREKILELMTEARVVLAPSVMDGIPNTLLEAMAGGAIPIVSPLPTITPHVSEAENVFFARNLYPHEIGEAILKAMSAGEQHDQMARTNLSLVRKLGDKRHFEQPIRAYYAEMLAQRHRPSEAGGLALHKQRAV
jgi:glycosyltransferase involved in cell wall biosynthesis